jgi:hypothetical protein
MKIRNILVVTHSKHEKTYPTDKRDVVFAPYEGTYEYNPKTSKWEATVKPKDKKWVALHKAAGNRSDRRLANHYDMKQKYPQLFVKGKALAEGGVRLVGQTLVISGQDPQDIHTFYQTGEIPTKNCPKKYIQK